jgi:hypothetical protein
MAISKFNGKYNFKIFIEIDIAIIDIDLLHLQKL